MSPTSHHEVPSSLVEQVLNLPRETQDQLIAIVLDSRDDLGDTPGDQVDWAKEILRRSDELAAGPYDAMTREESETAIRAAIYKLGLTL